MPRSLGILSVKILTQSVVTIKYFQVGFILASTHQQQFPVEPAIRKQDTAVVLFVEGKQTGYVL